MSFTPARARYDSSLEALKRHFRVLLKRELTPREERWLELSRPLLPLDGELTPELHTETSPQPTTPFQPRTSLKKSA